MFTPIFILGQFIIVTLIYAPYRAKTIQYLYSKTDYRLNRAYRKANLIISLDNYFTTYNQQKLK